jgi:predicted ATPase/class 3 adenylate cyclase/DNA-binding CsgD family transcriptional regulator
MHSHSTPIVPFALPTGTVTFLLTDIEGSARLWESAGEAMPGVVGRHYEILDAAIARHDGVRPVEQGEGDSVVAAFTRAGDALVAALEAQRTLHAEDWPEGVALRVRMALHTGDAELRDRGNYFGAALNRCARLRGVARGGQVLLSRATHDLVEGGLPDGVELVDLGVHRLRDLGRPEHVFALSHPDLPAILEPLRALDAVPNNLPVELSSFVGRSGELADVAHELASARELTLTGAGGCGKTRIALQAAADGLDRYPDGAWWVELAPLADPALLGDAVAAAVGVRPLPGMTATEAVVARLASKRALVVLDNCEHVLDASADLLTALLGGCPEVSVLVTSREPLGLPGERSWRVPSLSLPAELAPEPTESLVQSDAVRLFVERAAQVRPGFAVTADSAPALAQICRDVDGIPLAIELAAARTRVLSVEQIAAGLADRFRLLTGGARTALPRQQTLRASVDWSHELLDEPERALLRRLGVFHGGFTLDVCEEVCSDDALGRDAILDLLTSLVDKSLVVAEERGAVARYRQLETVRHYALDKLAAAGETDRLRNRHRDAFVALAERVESDLLSEREPDALELLDAEAANLEAANDWAARTDPDKALLLCAALTFWWRLRGLFAAGESALRRALEAAPDEASRLRARALWARAYLAVNAGDSELGERCAREALAIGEELGDEWIQGRALHALALQQVMSDPDVAVPTCERCRELADAAGDDFTFADATQIVAWAYWTSDDYEAAIRESYLAFEAAERLGNRAIKAGHWILLALAPWSSADLERRRTLLERGLATGAEVGDPVSEGFATAYLALVELQAGAPAAALERLELCLERLVTGGAAVPLGLVQCHAALALIALGRRDEAHAILASVVERDADGFGSVLTISLSALAAVDRLRGDVDAARSHAERALEVAGQVGGLSWAALAQHQLGRLAAERGEWSDAERGLHHALGTLFEGGHAAEVPDSLEALAEVAAGLESHAEAARLLAGAARARSDLGLVRWTGEDERWEALERELRRTLGDDAYEAAAAEGSALTMADAVAYVRRARGSRKRPAGGWESLTPTELEVVRHAATGLTNPEIAKRMFISRGTVKVHLSHIYAKLSVRNRAELTAEAARKQTP